MNTMEILNSFPEPEGKILRNIDKQKCELAVEQIIQGGKKTLTEIVNLILEPGKGQDIRARHAVHATAIRVGGPGKEKIRRDFAHHLASTLSDDRPKAVKGFIIRQLQICAGINEASKIAVFLTDSDEHLYEYAAQALEAIGSKSVRYFREAYPKAEGAPRLTILQGLGVLRDLSSTDVFRRATKDEDLEIRLAGLWGLMRIASAEDADLLLRQSSKERGWGHIKATAYCMELAESLTKSGKMKTARFIYKEIQKSRTKKNEQHLQSAARNALQKL